MAQTLESFLFFPCVVSSQRGGTDMTRGTTSRRTTCQAQELSSAWPANFYFGPGHTQTVLAFDSKLLTRTGCGEYGPILYIHVYMQLFWQHDMGWICCNALGSKSFWHSSDCCCLILNSFLRHHVGDCMEGIENRERAWKMALVETNWTHTPPPKEKKLGENGTWRKRIEHKTIKITLLVS